MSSKPNKRDRGPGQRGGRLLRRTFALAVVLVSGGLVTSGVVELFFRHRENVEAIRVLQQEMARGAAFKIHQFVRDIEKTVRVASQTQTLVNSGLTKAYRFDLIKLLKTTPAVAEASVLDLRGRELIKLSRIEMGLKENLQDRSSEEAFIRARGGKSYYGQVYFVRNSEPYMTLALPIERYAGEVIGVLIAKVTLKYIWDVVSEIKAGREGYTYVVSGTGDLIAHPDISLVLEKRNVKSLPQVQAALSGARNPLGPQPNLVGQKVFLSYALIPDLGWAVLVERPVSEAYWPVYASMLRTSVLLLLGLGIALLASFLIRRKVVRPVEMLRAGAARIGSGDLDYRLEVKTGDELQALAEEFNNMAAALKEAYSRLEEKVAERTRQLASANQSLEEASQHKSRFLANVNHELRTPVSAIIGYARLILRETEGQISPLQRENLKDLLSNAERLLAQIDSLLDFSKIEAGKMEVHLEPVRVDEVIDGADSTIQSILDNNRVRFIREIAPDIPALSTDREKLRQIILNLLGNAVKFTERGEIKISASRQNRSLKLVVSDTGIGIEKEDLTQIFEEFHRGGLSSTNKYRGTGLGLAIVKKFVNLLGGEIAVDSEVGKGSTFTVTLPLDLSPLLRTAETPFDRAQDRPRTQSGES